MTSAVQHQAAGSVQESPDAGSDVRADVLAACRRARAASRAVGPLTRGE
jgi:hypothetical protein